MYVCLCEAVRQSEIESVIQNGARTVSEIGALCGAGTGCGQCRVELKQMLDKINGRATKAKQAHKVQVEFPDDKNS